MRRWSLSKVLGSVLPYGFHSVLGVIVLTNNVPSLQVSCARQGSHIHRAGRSRSGRRRDERDIRCQRSHRLSFHCTFLSSGQRLSSNAAPSRFRKNILPPVLQTERPGTLSSSSYSFTISGATAIGLPPIGHRCTIHLPLVRRRFRLITSRSSEREGVCTKLVPVKHAAILIDEKPISTQHELIPRIRMQAIDSFRNGGFHRNEGRPVSVKAFPC